MDTAQSPKDSLSELLPMPIQLSLVLHPPIGPQAGLQVVKIQHSSTQVRGGDHHMMPN